MSYQVGQKITVERLQIYAGSGSDSLRQYSKTISRVDDNEYGLFVQFKGQRNYHWFRATNDILATRALKYRVITEGTS